ncbi:MAG TPA: hypothetical protein VGV68_06480 [Terriglobia bacterium]|nr:hypothetical protein [Terriglobia bacterium]
MSAGAPSPVWFVVGPFAGAVQKFLYRLPMGAGSKLVFLAL